jgi:hypothetical protein
MNAHVTGVTFSDSFDSINVLAPTKSHGDIACLAGAVNIGPNKILGDLLLGPAVSVNSSQVAGKTYHDLNIDLPDVPLPPSNWLPAAFANQMIGGTVYRYVFQNNGDYTVNSSGSIYVGAGAQVSLQVQSPNFSATNIYVAGTSRPGKLLIYALGPAFTLAGDATVENGNPANLIYLGSAGNMSLTLNNNSTFTGTIYAPEANFTNNVLSKGHSKKATFNGSCVANSVYIDGSCTFNFDENLLRDPPLKRGFVVTSWREF